jgi:glc operon protein GlcG
MPVIQQQVISYEEAKKAVDALTQEISKRGKAGVIAVVDDHGELILLARMNGAPLSSINIAVNKAYSAARERKPSKDIGIAARRSEGGFDIGYFGDPKFTGWGGGVPIFAGKSVAGALAISGLPQAEDMELAAWAAQLIETNSAGSF